MASGTVHLKTEAADAFLQEQRRKTVEENLGLVGSIVRRFAHAGQDMEDLFQIGCIGLVKAVERFDANMGVKLSTYAVPVILGEIKRHLRDDGALRISRSIKTNAMHVRRAMEQLTQQNGDTPTIAQVAAQLKIAPEDVLVAMDALRPMQYLQAEDHQTGLALMDTIAAPDAEEHLLDRIALREAINTLPERERIILQMRYYHNLTQTQVAQHLSVSQVQISRLEKKLLLKLREQLTHQ